MFPECCSTRRERPVELVKGSFEMISWMPDECLKRHADNICIIFAHGSIICYFLQI